MSSFDMKQLAQPFVVSPAEIQDFFFPARTTAQLADVADSVNTKNKFAGKRCYESTLQLDYIADGPLPADTWTLNNGLGLTQVTPA